MGNVSSLMWSLMNDLKLHNMQSRRLVERRGSVERPTWAQSRYGKRVRFSLFIEFLLLESVKRLYGSSGFPMDPSHRDGLISCQTSQDALTLKALPGLYRFYTGLLTQGIDAKQVDDAAMLLKTGCLFTQNVQFLTGWVPENSSLRVDIQDQLVHIANLLTVHAALVLNAPLEVHRERLNGSLHSNGFRLSRYDLDEVFPAMRAVELKLAAQSAQRLRQLFGLFSRLTVKFDDSRVADQLVEFYNRVTAAKVVSVPPLTPYVAEYLLKHLNLDWLESAEGDVHYFRHGPGGIQENYADFNNQHKCCLFSDPSGNAQEFRKDAVFWINDPKYSFVNPSLLRFPFLVGYDGDLASCQKDLQGSCFYKITAVPKDERGARIIGAEPVLHQFVQLGVMDAIYAYHRHALLQRAVHFRDQSQNQLAARRGSLEAAFHQKSNSEITLDLKDASDHVSTQLVDAVFSRCPGLLSFLRRLRTEYFVLSSECRRIVGSKYPESPLASNNAIFPLSGTFSLMGSGLTFPLETDVILLIVLGAVAELAFGKKYETILAACENGGTEKSPLTWKLISRLLYVSRCIVFGDDTVISRRVFEPVVDALSKGGLVINDQKCCYKTSFRESCGTDWLYGHSVSFLRPRALVGADPSVRSLCRDLANVNNLLKQSLWTAALTCLLDALVSQNEQHRRSSRKGLTSSYVAIPLVECEQDRSAWYLSNDLLYCWLSGLSEDKEFSSLAPVPVRHRAYESSISYVDRYGFKHQSAIKGWSRPYVRVVRQEVLPLDRTEADRLYEALMPRPSDLYYSGRSDCTRWLFESSPGSTTTFDQQSSNLATNVSIEEAATQEAQQIESHLTRGQSTLRRQTVFSSAGVWHSRNVIYLTARNVRQLLRLLEQQ